MNLNNLSTIVLISLFSFTSLQSQTDIPYQLPPDRLVEIVDALPTPGINIAPGGEWMLIMERPGLPSIEEVSQPELRLGGLRINPRNNGGSRERYMNNLKLVSLADQKEFEVSGIPELARINNLQWSPDGTKAAFCLALEQGIELWVLDINTKQVKSLTPPIINDILFGLPYQWHPDSKSLIAKSIDTERISPPQSSSVPVGPVIQENAGKKSPLRTYQDLLKSPYDENLFEYYASSQLVTVPLEGETRKVGEKGIITSFSVSPDGTYLLVESIHRPYSYLVPYYKFPTLTEVWDLNGKLIHRIADLPLADDIPTGFGSVRKGPRSVQWRSDVPAQLFWVEALDEGDGSKEVKYRDQVFALNAPFSGEVEEGPKCSLRFNGITWGNASTAIISEQWWRSRTRIISRFSPSKFEADKVILFEINTEDRYADPGRFVSHTNPSGKRVLLSANRGRSLFLRGMGGSTRGYEPFIDSYDLRSGTSKRLWQSTPPYYEYPSYILDEAKNLILINRESVNEQPNYFVVDYRTGKSTRTTNYPHPHPDLSELEKHLITYQREDGVQLTGTLHLPYKEASKNKDLPMIMWAYPREFKDAAAAGQIDESPYSFDRINHWSPLVWLSQGYAVLNDAKMPIIGEGDKEPNDSFVKQLVASAKAAVDTVVEMGVADPEKIMIGGHSYGAFMTANLLAHSDLFVAGLARSGAYNRTLTPYGFQSEERTYWEAPDIYYSMSPFMHANKVNEPILLIHGMADNNSGTFPVQSERFYHALKGMGATVRLVMLPNESHGYRARESLLHMLWETDRWMKKYVSGETNGQE